MAKNKMTTCKYCGREIANNAKICPYCGGKNKKPIYKKVWFWVLIILLLLGMAGGGGKKSTTSNTAEISKEENSTRQSASTKAETKDKKVKEVESSKLTTAAAETEPKVPAEYRNAIKKAEVYSSMMYMSKAGIYDQLTSEYGDRFDTEAAQYAVENMTADWKSNALEKAKDYSSTMHMSKRGVYDQLISEYGEKFTEEEAQYAIDHLE